MGDLLRFDLVSIDDVACVRQLTRDVAREAGLAALEQTKLATAASELARHSLVDGGAGAVTYALEGTATTGFRLVVAVDGDASSPARRRAALARRSLDLLTIRGLVDSMDAGERTTRVSVALPAVTLASAETLRHRLQAIQPPVSPERLERRNVELADTLALLEAKSTELSGANAELGRLNAQLAGVNAELELTSRGVLDLNTELERRAEEVAASAARQSVLARQQAALAELGRVALGSRNGETLARQAVRTMRDGLDLSATAVLQFVPGARRLEVIAKDGCDLGTEAIELSARFWKRLRSGPIVTDLSAARGSFPFPAPPDARSGAAIAVDTPSGNWGVLVACDAETDHFDATTVAFMQAAVSLLASSIARTESEDAASYAARHDALTGLPNRVALLDHLAEVLGTGTTGSDAASRAVGLVFIDLDGFKQVNDTLGHVAGDLVLAETAHRLTKRTRPADVLARLGGDEFVVLFESSDASPSAAIAERLLAAFTDPFLVHGNEVFLAASAGVAMAGPDVTASQLLADADLAMYRAKQTTGSATSAFQPDMRTEVERATRLRNDLPRAHDRGEMRAVYQPIVGLADGAVHGVEALVRWHHPAFGEIAAEQTIAVAEKMGLIGDLSAWMMAESARAVSEWNVAHSDHAPLRLAVNINASMLDDPQLIAGLQALVTGVGLPFDLLDVEITETALVRRTTAILTSIDELRRRGARLAIDDFGTGYSSLISLANLPFDVLKIDRSFVTPLDDDGDRSIVRAMTGISRGRSLETIGEGIETLRQLAALITAECDFGQGYLFAKPLERDGLQLLEALEEDFAATVRQARLAPLSAVTRTPAGGSGPIRPARVLVVDDNPDDVELLRALLGSAGHEITEVSDPKRFFAALLATQPDLVLMDLRLPGTTGFDLVEQAGALLTMPVVGVTGYPSWVVDQDTRAHHFASIITKPVEPAALLARVADLVVSRYQRDKPQGVRGIPQPAVQGEASREEVRRGARTRR